MGLEYKYKYITTYSELVEAISDLSTNNKVVAVDTETTGFSCHSEKLSTVQLAGSKDFAYILDVLMLGEEAISKQLQTLFSNVRLLFFNFKFDCQFLWKIGIDVSDKCWSRGLDLIDLYIASVLLSNGLGLEQGLGHVVERYLSIAIDKSEQKSNWSIRPLTESQLGYAARDVIVLQLLFPILMREINSGGHQNIFRLESSIIPALASMEYNGANVDIHRLTTLVRDEVYKQTIDAEYRVLSYVNNRYSKYDFLGQLVDPGLQISSSQQMLKALRDLKIIDPTELRTKEDPYIKSTGKDVLGLLDIDKYPIIEPLLEHRGSIKLLNTYVDGIPDKINPVTNRLHCSINQLVSTGRMQASNPNLNSLPRPKSSLNVRSCFIPSEGNILILDDYNQIELRVIAEIIALNHKDDTMLKEFLEGKDPYANTAAMMSDMKYEDFITLEKSEYKRRRQSAKAVRLGFNYGMQYKKFKNYARINYGVSMSDKDAKESRDKYFSIYPGLQRYHDSFANNRIKEVETLDPYRRKRYWQEYPGVPGLSNLKVQGTSADIQKLAISKIYKDMWSKGYSPTKDRGVMLILSIHDELVMECREDLKEYGLHLLNAYMPEAGNEVLKLCPVTAEAQVVNNLSEKD